MTARTALARHAVTALGCAAGLVVGLVVVTSVRRDLRPHAWLEAHAPARFYVDSDCEFSQKLLADLARNPGPRAAVVIPLDQQPGPGRAALCGPALAEIRGRGGFAWSLLPDAYLCDRLADEARAWMKDQGEERVPGWVVDGEPLTVGFTDKTRETLRARGLLAAAP